MSVDIFGQRLLLNQFAEPTDSEIVSIVQKLIAVIPSSTIFNGLCEGLLSCHNAGEISSDQWAQFMIILNTDVTKKSASNQKSDDSTDPKPAQSAIFMPFDDDYMTDDLIPYIYTFLDSISHFNLEKTDKRLCVIGRFPHSNLYIFDRINNGKLLRYLLDEENPYLGRISRCTDLNVAEFGDNEIEPILCAVEQVQNLELRHLPRFLLENGIYLGTIQNYG